MVPRFYGTHRRVHNSLGFGSKSTHTDRLWKSFCMEHTLMRKRPRWPLVIATNPATPRNITLFSPYWLRWHLDIQKHCSSWQDYRRIKWQMLDKGIEAVHYQRLLLRPGYPTKRSSDSVNANALSMETSSCVGSYKNSRIMAWSSRITGMTLTSCPIESPTLPKRSRIY